MTQKNDVLLSIPSAAAHLVTPSPVQLPARAMLNDLPSHYRSKVFVSKMASHSLMTDAAVLLALLPRLQKATTYSNLHTLQQHLIHEIKAFETQTQQHGYRTETIFVARYILCTVLDEFILNTPWGHQKGWNEYALLNVFQNEHRGDERFFTILTRLKEDPAAHIELLELTYICLSLGYQGPYRTIENGKIQLDDIMDDLYQRIRWQQGDIKKELLISLLSKETKLSTTSYLPLWLVAAFTITVVLTFYTGTAYLLSRVAASFYHQVNIS